MHKTPLPQLVIFVNVNIVGREKPVLPGPQNAFKATLGRSHIKHFGSNILADFAFS
jgi:hypothetical protein